MNATAAALCLVVSAGATSGALFRVRAVDSYPYAQPDSPGIGGPMVVSGSLYQHTLGTTFGGSMPDNIDANPALAYDSYVAIDTQPSSGGDPDISGDGYFTDPSVGYLVGSPFATPGQVGALWALHPGGLGSGLASVSTAIFDGADSVFVGRFTFRTIDGSQPTGSLAIGPRGLSIDIFDPGTQSAGSVNTDTLLVDFSSFDTTVSSGVDGGDLLTYATAYTYQLRLHTFNAQIGNNRYLVNDMYVVQLPGPATAVPVLAVASTSVFWRRRRTSH